MSTYLFMLYNPLGPRGDVRARLPLLSVTRENSAVTTGARPAVVVTLYDLRGHRRVVLRCTVLRKP